MPDHSAYDIIGDIHGHADALELLLLKLGYIRKAGVYSHPAKRKVVFVGDFIDRGPKIRETLRLAKAMVDSGNALCVMGNHELNAISFHTPHVEKGGFFRDHSLKEITQHLETLNQFKQFDSEWAGYLEWFKTIPLFLEFDQFRVVHACWDNNHIHYLLKHYKGIKAGFLEKVNNKKEGSKMYHAVDESLKGKEHELPGGYTFTDKDGVERDKCRVRWWVKPEFRETLGDVLIDCPEELANDPIENLRDYHSYTDPKPVFFGYYWLTGKPCITNPQAICVDFSVAKGGVLAACRLDVVKGELKKTIIF